MRKSCEIWYNMRLEKRTLVQSSEALWKLMELFPRRWNSLCGLSSPSSPPR
eukprot:m.19044 g.19044  ORF g.19044 m.19044 type:complete len:51 (+) comp30634_c0_seq2:109-261(+)